MKVVAAVRIASAVISGWPDAPDLLRSRAAPVGGRWGKRAGRSRRTVLRALPEGNPASGRHELHRNDNRPRFVHPVPVFAHYPKSMGDPISFQRALMV